MKHRIQIQFLSIFKELSTLIVVFYLKLHVSNTRHVLPGIYYLIDTEKKMYELWSFKSIYCLIECCFPNDYLPVIEPFVVFLTTPCFLIECSNGQFGYNCMDNCSSLCVDGICDTKSGTCEQVSSLILTSNIKLIYSLNLISFLQVCQWY